MAEYIGWEILPLLLALVVLAYLLLMWVWPYQALKVAMALVSRTLIWLHAQERPLVPTSGPVLLIASPVSYMGWLLIVAACPRPVRCLILAGWTEQGLPGWLLRRAQAITARTGDRAGLEDALARAGAALDAGYMVCIFAEGCKATDGTLLTFSSVYDRLMQGRSVPVVPLAVHQPEGSLCTMHRGRFVRKYPAEIPSPAWLRFGKPLASVPATEARQALQELSATLAVVRNPWRRPVHRQFVRMAARHPFHPCWADSSSPGQDMTYGKAYVGAVCLMKLLRPLLGQEPIVGIWLPPGRGSALANIAIALLGKTSVNLNYTAAMDSTQSALRQCACKHVLTARRFTARLPIDPGPGVELVYLEDLLPKVGSRQKLLALLSVILLPGWFLERVVLGLARHTVDDLATIVFSSGSTGEPKGVMLTHGNVAANAESMIQATSFNQADSLLGVLPFFHSFGYTVSLWAPLQIGGSAVYHADPRQAREIGELCRKYRCSIYLSTATFLRFCLRRCEPQDFSSVRILVCGAEKLPPSLSLDFEKQFGVLPLEGYGCTELSPASAANMPDQTFGSLTQVHNKLGTVGPPLPGCAARIIHPDTYQPVPLGEEGMVIMTGANVMKGYLHRPDLTRSVILDGWYVTGDMGRLDADGHLTLTGRLSRFAKIGGEMVPLEKIEEALHDALETSERICAVTCIPDDSRGERIVVLYIESHLIQTGSCVRTWTKQLEEKGWPNLWMPSERDFIPVPELPLLGSGKLNLKGVKEIAISSISNRHAGRSR
ncbi:MAG: AMP-binding protein [Gemmataceae bacterium]